MYSDTYIYIFINFLTKNYPLTVAFPILFLLLVLFVFIIKNPCYVNFIGLTETCHSTYILLFMIVSIVLICKSLWIKASAK